MTLANMKDELLTLERAIKSREKDIKMEIAVVNRFKERVMFLKDRIQMIESGQLELFKQNVQTQEIKNERYK